MRWWLTALLLTAGCIPSAAAPAATAATDEGGEELVEEPADARTQIREANLNPVLAAYSSAMTDWMDEDELAAVAELDLTDTMRGDPQRLRYIAADRTVREILPLALEAQGDETLDELAAQLRVLPPLLNRDTDAVAAPFVQSAMRALRRVRAGLPAVPAPRPMVQGADGEMRAPRPTRRAPTANNPLNLPELPPDDSLEVASQEVDPELELQYAEAMTEYSEAYQRAFDVSPHHADAAAAAASDAIDVALTMQHAVQEYGVPRELVVQSATRLVQDMAGAARRREGMPRLIRRTPEVLDQGVATPTGGAGAAAATSPDATAAAPSPDAIAATPPPSAQQPSAQQPSTQQP